MIAKCFSTIVLFLLPLLAHAQTNPVPGYIISNQGDTIRGVINYRSSEKNGQSCMFMPTNATEYRDYLPSEIKGYRFDSDGVYYVSRSFFVKGKEKLIFAEYLLQGGVSLYYYKEDDVDYYYMVDENGEIASITNGDENISLAEASGAELQSFKRNQIREAARLLSKSPEALSQLWKKDVSSRNLTDIVRRYDEQYCSNYGDCVQFRYDAGETRAVRARLKATAGVDFVHFTAYRGDGDPMKTSYFSPVMGVGADFSFPRFSKNLSIETMLLFSFAHIKENLPSNSHNYQSSGTQRSMSQENAELDMKMLHLRIGPSWVTNTNKKISFIVHGGFLIGNIIGLDSKGMASFEIGQRDNFGEPVYWNHRFGLGAYLGLGGDIKIADHRLQITADYSYVNSLSLETKSHHFSIHAAFIL